MVDREISVIDDVFISPDSRDFILRHDSLSRQQSRGDRAEDNLSWFIADLRSGRLDRYGGTSVAYHKGVLCGQSPEGRALYSRAADYYGSSDLAVFRVPAEGRRVPLEGAFGQY